MAYRLITPSPRQRQNESTANRKTTKTKPWLLLVCSVLVLAIGLLTFLVMRPLPELKPVNYSATMPDKKAVALAWPNYGQAALGAAGYGVLESNGDQSSVPMASVAKVVTALAVLQKKPLGANQQGPTLTMTPADVALHDKYFSEGGSIVDVQQGEQLTEYQALQALLLPSANNMADSLAIWSFGSLDNYLAYVNQWLSSQGLAATHMDDASGFSPQTVSSASDLVKIGTLALSNPALAAVVKQESATLPVAGNVNNTNWLLNQDGVIGIKTGNTEQARGCYLFAAKRTVQNQSITIIGAVMGAPDLSAAIRDSRPLISSMDSGFKTAVLVEKGKVFGQYSAPWGASAKAVTKKDIKAIVWQNSDTSQAIRLANIQAPKATGSTVGSIKINYGTQTAGSALILNKDIEKPSLSWRIFH